MAINFSVSYTFSPSTTIASGQVNTNFSDIAGVWNGLEAKTKTFSNLGVDTELKSGGTIKAADGTVSAPSITFTSNTGVGLYLSGSTIGLVGFNLNAYRRPVLQYASATVVNMETGINGTAGQTRILFPDGMIRTDSTAGRINCNLAQVAALTGTAQSGIQTGSVAANTWYGFYAVKSQVNATDIVHVASIVTPVQANWATLNTNFGTNGWVYLGELPYGDNAGATTAIPTFIMAGNHVWFSNSMNGHATLQVSGIRLAGSAGASSITWTYAAGTAAAQVPSHILVGDVAWTGNSANQLFLTDAATGTIYYHGEVGAAVDIIRWAILPLTAGFITSTSNSIAQDLNLAGYVDGVLGVGSNPML